MNEKLPFRPVVGSNEAILNSNPREGYVWFATDTKKIYYSDGKSFLSMGGNTGIYYGNMELTGDEDTDQDEFEFLLDDIDGNESVTDGSYKRPNIDDLILNIPDGCFYRVINVLDNSTKFIGQRLTIAGSGGGGGGSGGGASSTVLKIVDADNEGFRKYFTQDATEAKLRFTVSATPQMPDNGITLITYKIAGQSEVITNTDFQDFGTIEFDLAPYLSKMSTTTVTNVSITVEDLYGARKTAIFYVSVVKLILTSDIKETILTTPTGIISYQCTPSGGSSLSNKEVIISFYDAAGNHLSNFDVIEPISVANNSISPIVKVPAIGVYTMKVTYRGTVNSDINSQAIESNELIYKAVYYDENPQLVVSVPPKTVEQYSTVKINYMVAVATDSIAKVKVTLIKNKEEKIQEIDYNTLNEWSIYFDNIGTYDLSISALGVTEVLPTINVIPYSGNIPVINKTGLTLNYSAVNRSNTEINKDEWTYLNPLNNIEYGFKFENFAWGDINGWQKDEDNVDMLHLSSGAKITLEDYSPYVNNAMRTGQTIELDFMISGVTDFSKPLIHCLSYDNSNNIQVGFNITGQESTLNTYLIKATGGTITEGDSVQDQIYNTQLQGVTAKFIENKRIHLTWVVERNNGSYPMIKTYLNGVLSGITQYTASGSSPDTMLENPNYPARLIFDSTYGNINIYNIRIYEQSVLNSNVVIDNYIATYGSTEEKAKKYEDNINVLDSENNISVSTIETAHDNYGYKLSLPYIKISGGSKLIKDDDSGNYYLNTSDTTQGLPTAKKDYRTIDEFIFVDHNGNRPEFNQKSAFKEDGSFNGIVMYGQGTSSMEYPVKNLRFKSKLRNNNEKFLFTINDNQVDLVCLKVDYMESSGSHNTGTGNLVQNLLDSMTGMKTPGQEKWTTENQKILTAIQGFPVAVFYKNSKDENAPYEFVGKGNFNLDKATHEPFGFMSDPEEQPETISDSTFGWDINNGTNTIFGTVQNRPNYITPEEKPIINAIHCYEFLNNAARLANFRSDSSEETFEESFFKTVDSDGDKVPNWFTAYESRYPEGDADDGSDINIGPFFRLCSWLNSTSQAEATNTSLENPYTGLDGVIYTTDTAQYRLAKFKKEFDQYLNLDFTAFYYVLTHVLLMIDSRAKNMMIATWDNRIWYPIFYDMDTMLGLNNYGYNKFSYDVEDTDENIYNGQDSVLWNNFRDGFPEKIRDTYQKMQTAGLTYTKLLKNYNDNQADAANENIYNADAKYKYIRPFSESYIGGDGEIVLPGTKDFLYAAQGSRSMHREWWLMNRINYFNGKYLSDEYKNDKYEMRLYTPQVSGYYAAVYTPLEEEFNAGLYYINTGTADRPIYTKAPTWAETGITYYKWVASDDKLAATIAAVPPNNDYILTPLYNQYISVAYGGSNGQTTAPTYAAANEPLNVVAPAGAEYNDTETYVYGGSMLKDLGDLSKQYLGAFRFPEKQTKLESLTLGNGNRDYYNPNFSSLTIGSQAPYLANLNVMNCIGLKGRSLDLSQCQNLKTILATGTDITSVSLPSYGILSELRLPSTITTLALNNQPHLSDTKFTIGEGYSIYNEDTKTYDYIYTHKGGTQIITLDIQNTPINSYQIVKDCEKTLQRVRLTDINWTIGNAQKNDITNLDDLEKISVTVLDILNRKTVYAVENTAGLGKKQVITGKIIFKSELKLTPEQAMAIYNKYINEDTFPNLDFVFEGLNIFNVNILDGNGNIYWTKKIGYQGYITKDFLSSGPRGKFETPRMNSTIQYVYTFNNQWNILINNTIQEKIITGSSDEGYEGWPIAEDYAVQSDITLKPDFTATLQKYLITISNTDFESDFITSKEFEYGTLLKDAIAELEVELDNRIPRRDDSLLDFDKTYRFEGYNTDKAATIALQFGDDYIVSGSKEYYAIFKPVSVYSNVYRNYFNYSLVYSYGDGYDTAFDIAGVNIIGINKTLRGKVTIPAYIELNTGKYPVIGLGKNTMYSSENGLFENNTDITHIFFETDPETVGTIKPNRFRVINERVFKNATALKYFQFTDGLRVIGDYAFQFVPLENDRNVSEASFTFSPNIVRVGRYAFNQAFNYNGIATIYIPSSIRRLDGFAFSISRVGNGSSIVIGTKDNMSLLDFSLSENASSTSTPIYHDEGKITLIDFYSQNYDEGDTAQLGKASGVHSVESLIGPYTEIVNIY